MIGQMSSCSMCLMDAVLRTSRVSGMTLSDLLSDLADVLGNEVLIRLDDMMKVSDALVLSRDWRAYLD